MPVDESSKQTKGYAFIEYTTPAGAVAALEQLNGYKLDRQHVFAVNRADDFERYARVADEYVAPEEKEAAPRANLHSWLLDARGRDQFAIRWGDETELFWNDAAQSRAEPVHKRQFWTESYVQWSPLGHYLTTVHRQGAALWGGPDWARLQRFAHQGLQFLDFSPGERYLVSASVREPANPREQTTCTVHFFDVRSGRLLHTFQARRTSPPFHALRRRACCPLPAASLCEGRAERAAARGGAQGGLEDFQLPAAAAAGPRGGGFVWPVFRWAGGLEDKYFAKIGKNAIYVYEARSPAARVSLLCCCCCCVRAHGTAAWGGGCMRRSGSARVCVRGAL